MADVRHSGTPDHLAGGNLLPEGWVRTQLHTISEIVTGKTPSKKEPGYFNGKIPFIKPGDILDQGLLSTVEDSLSDEGAGQVPNIPEGSIVVTCIGNLGRCAITTKRSATNQQINGVVPVADVNLWFLYYQIRTLKEWMLTESSATTVTIINKSKFSQAPIALPPLAEQKVIAEKLDTLLAQVDTTKARLERIPDIIKRFRQSVLAAAVSGKLTKTISTQLVDREIVKFEDILRDKKHLSYGVLKPGDFDPNGVPMLRVMDIGEWGSYNDTEVFKIDPSLANEYKRTTLETGDIVLSVMATIGRPAIVPRELHGANVNRALAVIKLRGDILPEYIELQLLSPNFQSAFVEKQIGSAQKRINLSDLREFNIWIPEREKQVKIVSRVEELFAFADSIEQKAAAALERVNSLTQSILAKAFRGELTADWRTANPELICGDNSAEALLVKIHGERELLKKKPKRPNSKKKVGNQVTKKIIKVVDALVEAGKPLSGQQLLSAAGYPNDSNTQVLEQFFLDIRDSLSRKLIIQLERKDGEDWFSLPEIKAEK